jgi:hypothetical protein
VRCSRYFRQSLYPMHGRVYTDRYGIETRIVRSMQICAWRGRRALAWMRRIAKTNHGFRTSE